jgi:hypothetical protein
VGREAMGNSSMKIALITREGRGFSVRQALMCT